METRTPDLSPQLILGLFAIAAGVLFTLDNLSVLDSRQFLRYWPVLLMAVGIAKIVDSKMFSVGGVLVTLVGTLLLLENLRVIRFRFWIFWPLLLVFIGVTLVRRAFASDGPRAASVDSTFRSFALMGGVERNCSSQEFEAAELTAIMGGCEIDLRRASIAGREAVIDTFAFWGGVEIKVPPDWQVVARGVPIMGGFVDSTKPPAVDTGKRLTVKGVAVMGGVEIKN